MPAAVPVSVRLSVTSLDATRGEHTLHSRPAAPDDAAVFARAIERYDGGAASWGVRHETGLALFAWLDGTDHWLTRLRGDRPDALALEFSAADGVDPQFLEAPWELLADDTDCLATRDGLAFSVVRRFGKATAPPPPSVYRPGVAFMAADPRGNSVPLNYEAEERAILDAVGTAGVDFLCEDTGNLAVLAERLRLETREEAAVEIVHLSCHGVKGADRPVLALEGETGETELAGAKEIAEAFGDFRPRLLFVSACNTAEPDQMLGSLAGDLARRGFSAVIGWAGKVDDDAATRFAAELYGELRRQSTLEAAIGLARTRLARDTRDAVKGEWPKARVYLGAEGGGRICGGSQARRWHNPDRADQEFLDKATKNIPVASSHEFVGRRRPLQEILSRLRNYQPTVIHGLGQHGKSSLAARIASRFPGHDLVVVFGDYTPRGILNAIQASLALEGHAGAMEARQIIGEELGRLDSSPDALLSALARLLNGPFQGFQTTPDNANPGRPKEYRPILMIVDDFEQALEPVTGSTHRVKPELVPGITALVRAFASTKHTSLLLFTCRFVFTCGDQNQNAAQRLEFFPLPDMSRGELLRQSLQLARQKVAAQVKREARQSHERVWEREKALYTELAEVVGLAFGSPSLMSRAARLRAESPEAFDRLKAAATEYQKTGRAIDQEFHAFIEYLAIDHLLGLLDGTEREFLRRSTLFQIPAPEEVLALLHPAGTAAGSIARATIARLLGLGLMNRFENPFAFRKGHDHALIDPLVRPKVDPEGGGS